MRRGYLKKRGGRGSRKRYRKKEKVEGWIEGDTSGNVYVSAFETVEMGLFYYIIFVFFIGV